MSSHLARRAAPALFCALLLCASCGGGGGGGPLLTTFNVTSVSPNSVVGLLGGQEVTIHGVSFLDVLFTQVTFGGSAASALTVVDDFTLRAVIPPAPLGVPQTVSVSVSTFQAGTRSLANAFTYMDTPALANISPALFTPTGAEDFTINATSFGLSGPGTVQVSFAGIGSVPGLLSADGSSITGRAPLAPGAPPAGPLAVTVTPGVGPVLDVLNPVAYSWSAPLFVPVPFQAIGGASRPMRLADGHALLCFPGANGIWGDADDEVVLLSGPPSTPAAQALRRPTNIPVGFLSALNSIPAVLDGDTACVYSVGPDGAAATADDRAVLLDTLISGPVIADLPPFVLNTAPVAALGPDLVAFGAAGADGLLGTADDVVVAMQLVGTAPIIGGMTVVGPLDRTGPGSCSIPQSADGTSMFLVTAGGNALPGDADDVMVLVSPLPWLAATPGHFAPAPSPTQRAIVLSATRAIVPSAGPNGVPGTADDTLEVYTFAGGALARTSRPLGLPLGMGALRHAVRLGGAGVVLASSGPDATAGNLDDRVLIYVDAATSASLSVAAPGLPLLAGLESSEVVMIGPGIDLVGGGGDDEARRIAADGATTSFATVPFFTQAGLPAADGSRVFAVGPGLDRAYGTGDEELLVFSVRALGASRDATALPLGLPFQRLGAGQPVVPVGATWGLVQAPGPDGNFGTADDAYVLARY
ncbi:MAG: IPT/TIG domain-containing protein [Planctomycetaceae bacterium]